MDFETALELFKSFPACQMRIFKQFSGFPDNGDQAGGYVVFAYASVANEPCYCELRDYAKARNLSITPFGQYLMFFRSNKSSPGF
jgi:hypothetical protein